MIVPGVCEHLDSPRLELLDQMLQALWCAINPEVVVWDDALVILQNDPVLSDGCFLLDQLSVPVAQSLLDQLTFPLLLFLLLL